MHDAEIPCLNLRTFSKLEPLNLKIGWLLGCLGCAVSCIPSLAVRRARGCQGADASLLERATMARIRLTGMQAEHACCPAICGWRIQPAAAAANQPKALAAISASVLNLNRTHMASLWSQGSAEAWQAALDGYGEAVAGLGKEGLSALDQ